MGLPLRYRSRRSPTECRSEPPLPGNTDDVAADSEVPLLTLVPHNPDVVELPGNDVPVPTLIPPPSKVVLEPDNPSDGLPIAKHVVPFPVIPIVAAGAVLSPGDASSVASIGIPVGGTGELGAMPSGEVAPIGLPIPPTCPPTYAKTVVQLKSTASIAAINTRGIMISNVPT